MKIKILSLFVFLCALVGCGVSEKTELEKFAEQEVKTVSWYKEHSVEREAVLKYCAENVGVLKENANCVNAAAVVASAFDSKERIETPKAIQFDKKTD